MSIVYLPSADLPDTRLTGCDRRLIKATTPWQPDSDDSGYIISAMEGQNAFNLAAALLNAVPESVMAERREKVAKSLDNLIAWMPEPESWAVVPGPEGTAARLLAGNKVFEIWLKISSQSPTWTVQATSRSLDDRAAVVSVKHTSPIQGKTPTQWQIKYADGTAMDATGQFEDDEPHSSEKFARAVAARLGWLSSEPQPS
jgi:hypothetical protein